MPSFCVSLLILALCQDPAAPAAEPQVKAISPFVGSDVFAVLQIDLARLNGPDLATRVFGSPQPEMMADAKTATLKLTEDLRRAGARELSIVYSLIDLPGPPFVVVPLNDGADAKAISSLFARADKDSFFRYPATATVQNAVFGGSHEALERIRAELGPPRPELSAAFKAVGDPSIVVRLFLLPSADTRRVLEEMVPTFPDDLGGGPITDLTRGLVWAGAGLVGGPQPSLKLVIATTSADASKDVLRLGENLIGYLRKSPEVQKTIPGLSKLLPDIKPEIVNNRITFKVEAQQAVAMIDAVLGPARSNAMFRECINNQKQLGLALYRYHQRHNNFPPAFSSSKDGKPLLSWRVLILPFLDENALYQEFHLDEPWDSPHNRALVAKMPAIYRCPFEGHNIAAEGKTRYLAPRGTGTIMRGGEPVGFRIITDGASNTILVIDGRDDQAVAWTEPRDMEVDPPLAVEQFLKTPSHRGWVSLFADGAVRTLGGSIAPATFRALLTFAGGEVIRAEDL
jgi:hypothetical protein